MSNDNAPLALALGAGAGLGLCYLLRDHDHADKKINAAPAAVTADAAATATRSAGSAKTTAPAPCSLRLDAKGLTSDGIAIDIRTAVTRCQAAGRADLVVADDAPGSAYAALAAAFGAAGILISKRRNARPRRRKRSRRQAAPPVDLPAFAATVRALADQIDQNPTADGLARGRFGERKVFIAAIRRALRRTDYASLPREVVDRLLVDANREGLLELARADLVMAMDPAEVRDSLVRHLTAGWHFVVAPREDQWRGARPPRYLAWCGTCHSGARLETNSRREAEAHATSHMRLYPGHDVHVTDRWKERARDDRTTPTYQQFTLRSYPEGDRADAVVRHFHAEPATSWKDGYYRLIAAGIVDARQAGRTHEPGGWMLSVDPADHRASDAEPLP